MGNLARTDSTHVKDTASFEGGVDCWTAVCPFPIVLVGWMERIACLFSMERCDLIEKGCGKEADDKKEYDNEPLQWMPLLGLDPEIGWQEEVLLVAVEV